MTKDDVTSAAEEAEELLYTNSNVIRFEMVGSAVYHAEPNDVDFLVEVQRLGLTFGDGFEMCSQEDYGSGESAFVSLRRGNLNLIVTDDTDFYVRMSMASEVCHALKLQTRSERILVHRIVRDGMSAAAAHAAADRVA